VIPGELSIRTALANQACYPAGGLDEIATLAVEFGRLLLEVGANARDAEQIAAQVALGLRADRMDLRVGYASMAITVGKGPEEVTRLRRVGPLGVNQTLYYSLQLLGSRISQGELTLTQARQELDNLLKASKRHTDFFVAVAVGIACAAFGRLLGVDWRAVGPIFVAAACGQLVRRRLALANVNVFISGVVVAFFGSTLSGLAAKWVGSQTVPRDMVVPVLLLVPGVPAFNAQLDVLEGRPTLGTARAVWVIAMMVCMAVGVWVSLGLLGEV
jgi:uncharacterized membrane protein YjjP (DUF1212 family)